MAQVTTWIGCLAILFTFSTLAQARMCTVLESEIRTIILTEKDICTQSYEARCSFFSSKQCTFYEKVPCERGKNVTKTFYKIVMKCCPGYKMLDNRTCTAVKGSGSDDSYWGSLDLPHGAYAGVACASLFLVCVVVIVIIHARGGHSFLCGSRCTAKKPQKPPEQKVELQQMITA